MHRGSGALEHIVRTSAVQGITLLMQLAQAGKRVAHLQHRPRRVMAQTPEQILWRGTEVEHRRAGMQQFAVALPEHGPAAGCEHGFPGPRQQFGDHFGFKVPERFLAMLVEKLTDAAADAALDFMVGVKKWHANLACHLFADAGLATAGHADQRNHVTSCSCIRPGRHKDCLRKQGPRSPSRDPTPAQAAMHRCTDSPPPASRRRCPTAQPRIERATPPAAQAGNRQAGSEHLQPSR
mmetsp:Transcript_18075/g.43195  ORF Transcript_18075/g.43195 Transcript_18075/m.43195 type:complete len:237 (+) Transcript_18075:5061-5771(+)